MVQQQKDIQSSSQEILQEERYLWMARAFSLVALLSFVANILMLFALSGLNPLVRVQPFYLQAQAKEEQVVSIVRPPKSELDSDVLQDSLVREYLLARFGISSDTKELERRWGIDGPVFAMSAPSVYKTFFDESEKLLKRANDEGLTRDVKINVVAHKESYPDGVNVWVAEIETISMSQNVSNSISDKWKITMEVVFQSPSKNIEWSQRLRNPLGFTVTRFGRERITGSDKIS